MQHWKGDIDAPVVSICCITYDHEEYLSEAIDSFLMQETDFPFEILIHDDASTDGTTDIVRDYAKRYPNLIRTVIQTENQYSKKPIITPRFLFPISRGKYIAMCEGDDYWCDPKKLERQVSALSAHQSVNLCFHPAICVDTEGRKKRVLSAHYADQRLVSPVQVILGGGGFCPTPSLFFRSSITDAVVSCLENAEFGDKFTQIIGSTPGGALFLPEAMCCYRIGLAHSWTTAMINPDRLAKYEARLSAPYQWLREYYAGNYSSELKESESKEYFDLATKYLLVDCYDGFRRSICKSREVFPRLHIWQLLLFQVREMKVIAWAAGSVYGSVRAVLKLLGR